MKYAWIALLSMMLNPTLVSATGFQLGFGGLTPHYDVGPGDHNYCNQIGESDIIYNRTYYLRIEGKRDAFTFMAGYDSICSPIEGLFYTLKLYEGKWFGLGLIGGAYEFNMNNWIYEEHHAPAGVLAVYPVYSKVGKNFYFVPVLGAEVNLGLAHAGSWSLWMNSIITPIISNISISLKKTF